MIPITSSSNAPLSPAVDAGATNAARAENPARSTDTIQSPASDTAESSSGCFCTICNKIGAICTYFSTQMTRFLDYLFPQRIQNRVLEQRLEAHFTSAMNGIRDPRASAYEKLQCVYRYTFFVAADERNNQGFNPHIERTFGLNFSSSFEGTVSSNLREIFAALPANLSNAIVTKASQLHGEARFSLASYHHVRSATQFLLELYPDYYLSILSSSRPELPAVGIDKVRALGRLVSFNPDVRYEGINLDSTMNEEALVTNIRSKMENMPENIKVRLYEKMWNLVQPRDGREAFLENPRSAEARQAVEEACRTLTIAHFEFL